MFSRTEDPIIMSTCLEPKDKRRAEAAEEVVLMIAEAPSGWLDRVHEYDAQLYRFLLKLEDAAKEVAEQMTRGKWV